MQAMHAAHVVNERETAGRRENVGDSSRAWWSAGLEGQELSSHFLVESLVEGAGNYKRPNGL